MTSKVLSYGALVLTLFGSLAANAAIKVQCVGMVQDTNYCLDDMCSDRSSMVLKDLDRPYLMNFKFSGEADSKLRTKEYDYQSRYEFTLYKSGSSASSHLEVRVKDEQETRFFVEAKAGQKLRISYKSSDGSEGGARYDLKCELSE